MAASDLAAPDLAPLAPGARARDVAVLDALAAMVDRAGLRVGDKLPPEVGLARELGVGRSTVREALKRLEGLGVIRRRRGDGTYLAARVPTSDGGVPLTVRLEGEALLRLLEVRRALDPEASRLAATRATPARRARVARLCDALLAAVARGGPWRDADMAFHGAVHEAAGNPLFGALLRRLDEMLERSDASPFARPAFGLASFPPHRDLADAIVAGDPEAAAAAAHAIIDAVEREIAAIVAAPEDAS